MEATILQKGMILGLYRGHWKENGSYYMILGYYIGVGGCVASDVQSP